MAQLDTGFCELCDRRVAVVRQAPNHILHLLLSIVTAGIWLIVWAILSLRAGVWRCRECGSRHVRVGETQQGRHNPFSGMLGECVAAVAIVLVITAVALALH